MLNEKKNSYNQNLFQGLGFFPAMALYRLISEGSTPFINLRWILLTFDMKDSNWYSLNAVMVFIAFGLCRVLPIVPMWIVCFQYPRLTIWPTVFLPYKVMYPVICAVLDVLNVYWYSKILVLVWKFFYTESPLSSSSSVSSIALKKEAPYSEQFCLLTSLLLQHFDILIYFTNVFFLNQSLFVIRVFICNLLLRFYIMKINFLNFLKSFFLDLQR